MKKILIILILLPYISWAGNKIDSVGQEYINQIKNLSSRIVFNEKSVQNDLRSSDTRVVDKNIEEMSRLNKEFKSLKLNALKYYNGKFPKAFALEWNKYETEINTAYKKKPKKEEFPDALVK